MGTESTDTKITKIWLNIAKKKTKPKPKKQEKKLDFGNIEKFKIP